MTIKKNILKYFVLSFSLAIIFYSCNDDKPKPSVYESKIIKTKIIPLDVGDNFLWIINSQLVEIDGANVLIMSGSDNGLTDNKLSFYDIDKGEKIHEIKFDSTKYLYDFHYINKDSILILYNLPDRLTMEEYSENQLQLSDYYGNIKTKFPYNFAKSKWLDKIGMNKLLPLTDIDVVIGDNLFVETLYKQNGDLGTKEFLDNPLPFLMRYNLTEQKFYVSDTNSFPNIKEGDFYPTSLHVKYFSQSVNGFPIVRYLYSSDIFEWDYKNDKLITHKLKSRILDTVEPMSYPSMYYQNKLKNYFTYVLYDKYRKLYFLVSGYNSDFYSNESPLYSAIIANDKFEYLGETYCQECPSFFTKNNMFSIKQTNEGRAIQIDYLNLYKTDADFVKYIDSCKNHLQNCREKMIELKKPYEKKDSSVLHFLKSKTKINRKDYTVLTIYPASGCIGCNDFMYDLISEMKSDLQYLSFYLIISDDNIDFINKELKKYDLKNMKNLFIDSLGTIKKSTVYDGLFNPRLIVVRDNEIKLDSIYKSEDTRTSLLPAFLGSFGLCTPSQKKEKK